MVNTTTNDREQLYLKYLTSCVHKQGKIEPNSSKEAQKLIRDLTNAIVEANKRRVDTGITSPFEVGNFEHGLDLYKKLQDRGVCGTTNPLSIDRHEFFNKAFVFYLDFLRNSEFFKTNEAKGNVTVAHTDNILVNTCANKLLKNHNLVLTGAPGTGKSHLAGEIAGAIGASSESTEFVQFHPSYDYTDFVEGLRPIGNQSDSSLGFKRKDGVFKKLCKEAIANSDKNYVMIIDEINRGEINKILGELFFSIDPGYRGDENRKMKTQYQNLVEPEDVFYEGFYVPKNVYIIATMNDIDRSVESMDFAIRRRFAWKDIKYSDTMYNIIESKSELSDVASEIYKRIMNLNNAILNAELGLSSAYQIGAAYFQKLTMYADVSDINQKFASLWDDHIQGVLFEYMRGSESPEENLKKLKDAYDLKIEYNSIGEPIPMENSPVMHTEAPEEQDDNE